VKSVLRLPEGLYENLLQHLLPPTPIAEEAAFLFVHEHRSSDGVQFDVLDSRKLGPSDFEIQAIDYLELRDQTRAALIARAHHLEASLVELHSHPGPFPAAFSVADRRGLAETVPHMWWRLKKRPYLAIVVAQTGFDALLWLESPTLPQALDGVLAGERWLQPTNQSLAGWL
jgi:hypothetical protein